MYGSKYAIHAFILHLISESILDSINKMHAYKYKLVMHAKKITSQDRVNIMLLKKVTMKQATISS